MSTPKQATTTTHNSGSRETAWKLGGGLFTDGNTRFVGKTDGGAEGVRTPDLLNAIQALYQLSYDPIRSGGKCKTLARNCQNQFELLHFEVPAPDFSLRA